MKPWVGILALVVLAIGFALQQEQTTVGTTQAPEKRVQMAAQNLHRQQFNQQGELIEQLRAASFTQYTDNSAQMTALQLDQQRLSVVADLASTEDQVTFDLTGNVTLNTNDRVELTTQQLLYQSDQQTGHAPGRAVMTRGGSQSVGQSLRFDIVNEFMEFEQHESSTFIIDRAQ